MLEIAAWVLGVLTLISLCAYVYGKAQEGKFLKAYYDGDESIENKVLYGDRVKRNKGIGKTVYVLVVLSATLLVFYLGCIWGPELDIEVVDLWTRRVVLADILLGCAAVVIWTFAAVGQPSKDEQSDEQLEKYKARVDKSTKFLIHVALLMIAIWLLAALFETVVEVSQETAGRWLFTLNK